jgi:hypothetical protein
VVPGYPPRDLLEKRDFVDANIACLNKLVEFIRDIGVICGYMARNPVDGGKYLFNHLIEIVILIVAVVSKQV